MNKLYIYNLFIYTIKILIILICVYFYYIGSLTLNRILIFIIVFFSIIAYSRVARLIMGLSNNNKVKKCVKDHNTFFRKLAFVLLEIYRWINPFIVFLTYTDKCLYQINRYITGTRFINYNFIIYLMLKYLLFFGLIKLIIYKYYSLWYQFDRLTIIEILFKRMYGLILSILIFTDLINNIINVLSQYNIWIYVLVYYVISTICVAWELLFFYYNLENEFINILQLKFINKIKIYKLIKYLIKVLLLIFSIIEKNLQEYSKMNVIIFLRSQYTWLGQTIISILRILVPDTYKESNFKERHLSIEFVRETTFFASGRIAYYVPLKNRISLKYFDYIGSLMNLILFKQTFELYWEGFKSELSYSRFFKLKSEIKHKPSIFLYIQLKVLANLYDVDNQPINRFMDWFYFDTKYKENLKIFNDKEKLIINRNLTFLKKVDRLRAKLMFFIIWDIEYYNNNNTKDYCWNNWVIKFNTILETTIFEPVNEAKVPIEWAINKRKLKFYDPEENMEFLNRLFDVLGIVNNVYILDMKAFIDLPYFVSEKFINYNEKIDEFIQIMYIHDFKRWEEKYCECDVFQIYEVEIAYKTEEYFKNLRLEWEISLGKESLEERNWELLKSLEKLMDKKY